MPNCFSECRNSKQRKGIWIQRPPVPEFRYRYVNSETSLNYEFRRTWDGWWICTFLCPISNAVTLAKHIFVKYLCFYAHFTFNEQSVHVPLMIFMNVSCSVQSWSTRWYPNGVSWQLVESYIEHDINNILMNFGTGGSPKSSNSGSKYHCYTR